MGDFISVLQSTPVPTILVVGGIAFLFLAVVGKFYGEITVSRERQVTAAVVGILLLLSGVAMYAIPVPPPGSTPPTTTTDAAAVLV